MSFGFTPASAFTLTALHAIGKRVYEFVFATCVDECLHHAPTPQIIVNWLVYPDIGECTSSALPTRLISARIIGAGREVLSCWYKGAEPT